MFCLRPFTDGVLGQLKSPSFLATVGNMSLARVVVQNLRESRKRRNLSQAALAKRARVHVSYISMLERGVRMPSLETLEILAKALGVAPLELLKERAAKPSR